MDQPQSLKTPSIDKERLRQKYQEERNKRLRADGNDQYLQVTGHLAHYLDDPYTAAVLPGSPVRRGCRKRASGTSASSRRAAISVAPGTGTGIPAPNAIQRR
jgi:hypothetical protein